MSKVLNHKVLSDTLAISECKDGWWLYDKTRGMNLSMKAESSEAAFLEALQYYQKRAQRIENDYKNLKAKVDHFVGQFADENEDESHYCDRCGTSS